MYLKYYYCIVIRLYLYPASEGSREVENLTERKNPHNPVYGVKDRCLSVRLLPNSTPIISGLAEQNGLKFFWTSLAKWYISKFFVCPKSGW